MDAKTTGGVSRAGDGRETAGSSAFSHVSIRGRQRGHENGKRFLEELPPRVGLPAQHTMSVEAAAAIAEELSLDDFLPANPEAVKRPEHAKVQRLDSFLGLAQQAERDEKQGHAPATTPAQLM